MSVVEDICLFRVGPGYDVLLGGVLYCEGGGVCECVVLCCQLLRYVLTIVV